MTPPIDLNSLEAALQGERHRGDRRDRERDGKRMAERKEQPDRNRPFAFLHQLAHDIVDRRRYGRHRRRGAARAHKRGTRCRGASAGPPARSTAQVQTRALTPKQKNVNRRDLGALIGRRVIDRVLRKVSTIRSSRDLPPARARTKRLSSFRSSTGYTPTDVCRVDSDRRQVSWLADRRLALPSRRQEASSGLSGRDFPLTVAGAAADWEPTLRHRIPFSPSREGPSVP